MCDVRCFALRDVELDFDSKGMAPMYASDMLYINGAPKGTFIHV